MNQERGSLRELMPVAAEMVDWLRATLGKQAADKIVLAGKAGRGGFYVAEVGPDGVFREFGSCKSGRRAHQALDGGVTWSGACDIRSTTPPTPPMGPPTPPTHAGNSAPDCALVGGVAISPGGSPIHAVGVRCR